MTELLTIQLDNREQLFYPTEARLAVKARDIGWVAYTFAKEERGYYYTSCTFNAQMSAYFAENPGTPAPARVEPRLAAPTARKPHDPTAPLPVTKQVFEWTRNNPSATREQALAAFPTVNPSTVKVQFGAARRG